MPKTTDKSPPKPKAPKLPKPKATPKKKRAVTRPVEKKVSAKKLARKLATLPPSASAPVAPVPPPIAIGASPAVLDRLWGVVMSRRDADPNLSHSARLLSRGTAKVAQKFGEEAVECLIEAARGNREALIYESADVLYHLIVLWVDAGVRPDEVWAELQRREGVSGIAEKASRVREMPLEAGLKTTKIP